MKKLITLVAVAAVMGVVGGRADTTNILSKQDVAIKGKLSPSGTAITSADLSGNTNVISHLDLEIIGDGGSTTNAEQWIGQVSNVSTNLLLKQQESVDMTPDSTTGGKFVSVFTGNGQVGTSLDAVILLSGSSKRTIKNGVTNETVKAKLQGIWADGSQAVSGSLGSVK